MFLHWLLFKTGWRRGFILYWQPRMSHSLIILLMRSFICWCIMLTSIPLCSVILNVFDVTLPSIKMAKSYDWGLVLSWRLSKWRTRISQRDKSLYYYKFVRPLKVSVRSRIYLRLATKRWCRRSHFQCRRPHIWSLKNGIAFFQGSSFSLE